MLKGLAEATKGMHLVNEDDVVAAGARAYMLGIELRDNPRNKPSERKLWEIGWTKKRDAFSSLLQRWKTL
jgi:hypothetical protein